MNIEIIPKKLSGKIIAPSSKSELHRLLICAALSDKKSEIKFNGICDDISVTINCLNSLGARIIFDEKSITVEPIKSARKEAELYCNESGSTLRFLLPLAAALEIRATFYAEKNLANRPVEPLLNEMRKHGVDVTADFPLQLSGKLESGKYEIDGNISSQFITGLLLSLPLCDGESFVKINKKIESKNYIDLTINTMKKFGVIVEKSDNLFSIKKSEFVGGIFTVEGDWSNAAFWLTAGVEVDGLNFNSLQGDKKISEILKEKPAEINAENIPDLVPIVAIFSATQKQTTRIFNAARLRFKESDRIKSTVEMLKSLGVIVEEKSDEIIIHGNGKIYGGTVNSYSDHRIAMSAAIAATFCEEPVTIINAEAVNKSYPKFFEIYKELGGQVNVL